MKNMFLLLALLSSWSLNASGNSDIITITVTHGGGYDLAYAGGKILY